MEHDQDEKKNREIGIFRYGVISDFVNGSALNRHERRRLIKEKSARRWEIPYSEKTRISASTIRRWIRDYQDHANDLGSLYPKPRSDRGISRTLDDDTAVALKAMRQEMKDAPVWRLIQEMETQQKVTPGIELNASIVYRFLNQNGLMHRSERVPEDRRRFEAEGVNHLWQSDVMHGPEVMHEGRMRCITRWPSGECPINYTSTTARRFGVRSSNM